MKKAILGMFALIMLFSFPGQARAIQPDVAFKVDVSTYLFRGSVRDIKVPPFMENGRAYVPVRYLAHALGINDQNIVWDAPSQTVFLNKEGYGGISLKVGNNAMQITTDKTIVYMDAAPVIRDGRLFLPARYVAEAFGASVVWDQEDQIVMIYCESLPSGTSTISQTSNSKTNAINNDHLTFDWEYKGKAQHLETRITGELAREHLAGIRKAEHPRFVMSDLLTYCTNEEDNELIKTVVDDLKANLPDVTDEQDYVDYVISFVQGLKYSEDVLTTGYEEYPRYPSETLLEKTGDCEDLSILAAVMIRELGYGVALIVFDDHVGIGIKGAGYLPGYCFENDGDQYYYLETTHTGWKVGWLPEDEFYYWPSVLPLP